MSDPVNHPSHYADGWSNGAEVIDITENLSFNRGNAVKYAARAGKKDPELELQDLEKAAWYLEREIELVRRQWDKPPTYNVVPGTWDEFFARYGPRAEPRVWDSLGDAPEGVLLRDANGFEGWEGDPGDHAYDEYGPFTEVLS